MTPSACIIAAGAATYVVSDDGGRQLTLRRLTALDRLRLFKAAGPLLAQNQPWLGMALIACSVAAIDDVPIPPPVNELQIEAMIGRLGDTGVKAIALALQPVAETTAAELSDRVGN
jgi:hypothetical protein